MKTLHIVADSISLGYGPYLAQNVRLWYKYSGKLNRLGTLDNPESENGGDLPMSLKDRDRARQQGIRLMCTFHIWASQYKRHSLQVT